MCIAMSALRNIKHEVCRRDANKARGEALRPSADCYISRKAQARQCFYYSKEFLVKHFVKNVFASSL